MQRCVGRYFVVEVRVDVCQMSICPVILCMVCAGILGVLWFGGRGVSTFQVFFDRVCESGVGCWGVCVMNEINVVLTNRSFSLNFMM